MDGLQTFTGARPLPVLRERGPRELAAALSRHVQGEVRFDEGSRALYATDGSNYRQVPLGVVVPRHLADLEIAVAICRAFDVPITSRGGGTSLAGQTCNVGVILECSKWLRRIEELDPEHRLAVVEPGVVLDDLRRAAEVHHLTFAPDPSTHDHCTLGGMIGNDSCGVHSMMGGTTAANVEELEILTYDGARFTVGATSESDYQAILRAGGRRAEIYRGVRELRDRHADRIRARFPRIPRRVSGYNLPALLPENGFHLARALVGSEGTLVTVLRAKLRLLPSPPVRSLLVLGYPDVFEAAAHVVEVGEAGAIGLEGLDEMLVEDMKKKRLHPERTRILPEGRGWLLVEFGGQSRAESDAKARALMARLDRERRAPSMKLFDDRREEAIVWKVRESGLGATARVPGQPDTWEGWEDSAVPPERLSTYLRELRALLQRFQFRASLYGHFGQGCVHTRIPFDLANARGIQEYRAFVERAADLVVSLGGSLSGEHGDGQSRAELEPRMFGPELVRAFEELKEIFDPRGKMNPGKIVRPYRIDENLRLGADYRPVRLPTRLQFPDDDRSFARAAERCVGIGECRRLEGGDMCPSYRVTLDEQHSTRGRAHLLFEMARGTTLRDGWRDEAVRGALDLCLSCKACKGECPMSVDMASYKAEFLSHYYEGRLRPRSAYAFGLIRTWARLASVAPTLANLPLRVPPLAALAKWAAGIEPRRRIPRFASVTFREHWARRPVVNAGRTPALLWPDTFNDHFEPAVLLAAAEALEDAGFQVILPDRPVCCGRPLYDYGMLDVARRTLLPALDALRPAIRAGVPIVGLEPSCVSVFHDEAQSFFPDDPDVRALRQGTFMFGNFLAERVPGWQPPRLERRALVQGHCHHKSILSFESSRPIFERMGLDARVLDAGCCGMAGGFGYEKPHYDVSIACAERALLPEVRKAGADVVIIADGFSCREQIEQDTGREALHLAQVLRMAKREGPDGPRHPRPEKGYAHARLPVPWTVRLREGALALAGLAALGAGAALAARRAGHWLQR